MPGPDAEDEPAYVAGDGDYAIEVVSGARHQDRLEWLAQGRGEEPAQYSCVAVLTPEADNPVDPGAVSVSIRGVRVGYLPMEAAAAMAAAMQRWGFERAVCEAMIEGGWYRSAQDKGDFCVRLDANPEFAPTADDDVVPPAYVARAAVPVPPQTVSNARSVGFGALATLAMLLLIGAVWLVVQPGARSVTSETAALIPAEPQSDPRPRRPAATIPADGVEAAALPPSASGLSAVRPVVAVIEPPREAVALPAPGPLPALAPAAGAAVGSVPGSIGAGTATASPSPPPPADESRRMPDPRRPAAGLAAPLTPEVLPLAVAAMAPPAPRPIAQPPLPVVRAVAVSSPADDVAAADGDTGPSDPPLPVARPPDDGDARAALSPRAQPAPSRSRAYDRGAREPRAARANARLRNAARHSRKARRPVQVQPSTPPAAPSRPDPQIVLPGGGMAARMFEGWAREWSSRLPPLGQPRPMH